ncbi:MAG: ribosomal RNA adenine methylase transferase [Parcubacteria group bacterium Greene0416_79]|nr:MAG: ribosomal RNA adenine methylase transferase [Parcubacteria group bacterium Greene0416_79]
MEQLLFLKEFFRHWKEVGSIAPSSRFLSERLCRQIDFCRAETLVEFGPGLGNITRELLRRMRPDARLIAFEINGNFCRRISEIGDLRLTVHNRSVCSLRDEAFGKADYVVSGIPLTLCSLQTREAVFSSSRSLLREGGVYLQYQFTPAVYPAIKRAFGNVELDFVLANTPPAFIYKSIHYAGDGGCAH